jgi:hypothetical protein
VHLSSFRVTNYKSFHDSEKVHFEPGFNVIVGRNNVGKTALSEAISLRFLDKPHHRSLVFPNTLADGVPIVTEVPSLPFWHPVLLGIQKIALAGKGDRLKVDSKRERPRLKILKSVEERGTKEEKKRTNTMLSFVY